MNKQCFMYIYYTQWLLLKENILMQQHETVPLLNYHLIHQLALEANTRNPDCIAGNSYLSVEDKLYLFVWKLYLCLAYEEDVKWMEPGCCRKMHRGSGFKREERHVELSWVTFWILLRDLIRKTYLCVSKSYLSLGQIIFVSWANHICVMYAAWIGFQERDKSMLSNILDLASWLDLGRVSLEYIYECQQKQGCSCVWFTPLVWQRIGSPISC